MATHKKTKVEQALKWRFILAGLALASLFTALQIPWLNKAAPNNYVGSHSGQAHATERDPIERSATPATDAQALAWECEFGTAFVKLGRLSFCRVGLLHMPLQSPDSAVLKYRVLIEQGLEHLSESFVDGVAAVLGASSGWARAGISFRHVEHGHDFTILVATPRATDRLCYPLRTGGKLSCASRERAVINAWRWQQGAKTWAEDVDGYRHYLVNHEVGHLLGARHTGCPKAGEPAPIMLQQTKYLRRCAANGEVTPRDLSVLGRVLPYLKKRLQSDGTLRLVRRPYRHKRWRRRSFRRSSRRSSRRYARSSRRARGCRICRRTRWGRKARRVRR